MVPVEVVRGHLSSSQRAVIASGLLPLLEREAKERQRRSQGRGKKVVNDFTTFSGNGRATLFAARIAHTNHSYVHAIRAIAAASPEVIEEIRNGRLTEASDLVVDPFVGGGTVAVACRALGRRWLGTEIDAEAVAVARKRLADMGKKEPGK